MKLNLGCGFNKLAGWVNVDKFDACSPDLVCDLEITPWVWASHSVTAILMNHSLEHLGADPNVFLSIMQELYRVSANGCEIEINVPHPRHDSFLGDPTHVRVITPHVLALFNKELNKEWQKKGIPNSQLGLYLDVDFEITQVTEILAAPYKSQVQQNLISAEDLKTLILERNNIVSEFRIKMRAIK